MLEGMQCCGMTASLGQFAGKHVDLISWQVEGKWLLMGGVGHVGQPIRWDCSFSIKQGGLSVTLPDRLARFFWLEK